MKQIQIVLIALVGAVTLIACKNEQGTQNSEPSKIVRFQVRMNPIVGRTRKWISKNLELTEHNI